eukprot:6995982-Ditylum_brightwellii.AAC.1
MDSPYSSPTIHLNTVGPAENQMYCLRESCKKGLAKYQEAERDEARNAEAAVAAVAAKQKQKKNNKNQQNNGIEETRKHQQVHLIHCMLTQYSLHKGLSKSGKDGEEAVMGEFSQPHKQKTSKPLFMDKLTEEQKREALWAIMFLKEKRCGRIKGRTCADG